MSLDNIEPDLVGRIIRFRESQGMTYRQFADMLGEHGGGISGPTVQKIEKSGRAIRVAELIVFSRALGVSVGELLGDPQGGQGGAVDVRLSRIKELSQQIADIATRSTGS